MKSPEIPLAEETIAKFEVVNNTAECDSLALKNIPKSETMSVSRILGMLG